MSPRAIAAACVSVAFTLIAIASHEAHASTTTGGKVIGTPGYYNYGPVVTQTGNVQDIFDCGDTASHTTDGIEHQQYDLANGAHVTVPLHFVLDETAGAWDSQYTCNPDVIQGHFPGGYTWAMFYVGTNSPAGTGNSIGVAFGTGPDYWVKNPAPVIATQDTTGTCYGAGQPDVSYIGGLLTMIYADTAGGSGNGGGGCAENHYLTVSADAVHWSAPQLVTANGLPTPTPSSGGAAYNPADGRWYMAFNENWRDPSTTGGIAERGQPGVMLYSTADPIAGTWQLLDTIDTVNTGQEGNFIASILTNADGTVYTPLLPSIELYYAQSSPRPAYNASGSALAAAGAFNSWDGYWALWTPGQPWRTLQRVDHAGGYHEVTTGWWDTGFYHLENVNLGKLAEAPTGDANIPVYLCKLGASNYIDTLRADCAGQYRIGVLGYIYPTPAADRTAIYACWVTSTGNFVSTDPNCEGQHIDTLEPGGLLGYSQN
jgi:hypothetical protein